MTSVIGPSSTIGAVILSSRNAPVNVVVFQCPLGDKGYDTDDIRYADWSHGTLSMIPTKSTRKIQFTVDHVLYSLRNRIERYFIKIKNACRIATHYPLRQAGCQLSGFRRNHLDPILA